MIVTIRDRIINILTANGYTADSVFPSGDIQDADLPFIVVMPSAATYEKRDTKTLVVTRDFLVDIFLVNLGIDDTEFWAGYLDDGLAPEVEDIISIIFTTPRLSLAGSPLAGVRDNYVEADDYVGASGWNDEVYAGTRLVVRVEYITSVR